jgi:hypothetical protein
VRRGTEWQDRRGEARFGWAGQGKARQAWPVVDGFGGARYSRCGVARHGEARRGRHGTERLGRAWWGEAGEAGRVTER